MTERGLRATALAGLCALLTMTGHALGGQSLPDSSLVLVLAPLLAGAFTTAAGRARGLFGTVMILGVGQLVLHLLLTILHASEHGGGFVAAPGGWLMLGMHAVATLVCALAVRHVDAAIAAILGRVLLRVGGPVPAARPLRVCAAAAAGRCARWARALAAVDVRRGPPVWC